MYKILLTALLFSVVTACAVPKNSIDRSRETYHPQTAEDRRENDMKSIFTSSDEPLVLFGGKKKSSGENGSGSGSGFAGTYLWRATLESISFMPLASIDSNGGSIITDWYQAPNSNEKLKFNIFILSSELQVNSIKVTAFRQVQSNGVWRSSEVNKELSRTIEDNILKKAIALKASQAK